MEFRIGAHRRRILCPAQMVTHVGGHFTDVHGTLDFDLTNPVGSSVEVVIDARRIWTGEPKRDDHLRSADFLDVDHFPEITFRGGEVVAIGALDFRVTGNLTIRGVTRPVTLDVRYLYFFVWPMPSPLATKMTPALVRRAITSSKPVG